MLVAVSFPPYAQAQVTEDTRIERTETAAVDESSLPIADPALSSAAAERPASTLWLFIRMILVLAVVVACVYAVVYLMKRSMNKDVGEGDQFLRVVSSVSIAPGKSVHVVSLLDDKAYLIGVTDNAVNLIGEVTDDSRDEPLCGYSSKCKEAAEFRRYPFDLYAAGNKKRRKRFQRRRR